VTRPSADILILPSEGDPTALRQQEGAACVHIGKIMFRARQRTLLVISRCLRRRVRKGRAGVVRSSATGYGTLRLAVGSRLEHSPVLWI
jgi:hypothetical protein